MEKAIVIVTPQSVRRKFDDDEFIESQEIKCFDHGSSSYRKVGDECSCKKDMTFFPYKKQNCYTKEEIGNLSGDCTGGFVTIGTYMIHPINSCILEKLVSIDVWDFENKGSWKADWNAQLSAFIVAKKYERGIRMNNSIGNWDGLFMRINFRCNIQPSVKNCMIVKFTGRRQYPLGDELLEEVNAKKLPKNQTNETGSESNITTQRPSISTETTTGSEVTTAATTIHTSTTITTTMITLQTEPNITIDYKSNQTLHTTLVAPTNQVIYIKTTEYYNMHKNSGAIRKRLLAVTVSIVVLTVIILIVLFIRHKHRSSRERLVSDTSPSIKKRMFYDSSV